MLLFFIEILYFVKIKQYAVLRINRAYRTDNLLNIGGGRDGCVKVAQLFTACGGNYVGNRGFTHARGSVKYKVGYIF